MWNGYLYNGITLNNYLDAKYSYAKEFGGKETNEDGYIIDYGLYFDVKILSDTIKDILKGIIDDAVSKSCQKSVCNILPEYPLDDNDEDYSVNRTNICNELLTFLENNNHRTEGSECFKSTILPQLSFRIHWGKGVNSSISEYAPYHHAETTHQLIFKRYAKKILKDSPFMLVFVNFPWYNNKITNFCKANETYYRSLARRTFCEYMHDDKTLMSSIDKKFMGKDTVFEVSRNLDGIIFIDDCSITEDSYFCYIYMNPNAIKACTHGMKDYLMSLIKRNGLFDDFQFDNY